MRLLVVVLAVSSAQAQADVEIRLRRAFIEQIKNRVTIDANFIVDAASRVHPPATDGDMHVAGRAKEIELPIVAEVMNARSSPAVVRRLRRSLGDGQPHATTGVWRLWGEHGGLQPQRQGDRIAPFTVTNPPHVFELHPVTTFESLDIHVSVNAIRGYQPKDATAAFATFEHLRGRIAATPTTITITTASSGMNYVEFQARLLRRPTRSRFGDGYFVLAAIESLTGELLVDQRRLVFVSDTDAGGRVKNLHQDQCLRVLGMPRINLSIVSWRVEHARDYPDVLNWPTPYEIVILAITGDCAGADDD